MRNVYLFIFIISFLCGHAQNNLRLLSAGGEPIHVSINKKPINRLPEAEVLVEHLEGDTVQIGILFEDKQSCSREVFLLNQGKHDQHKEYSYFVQRKNNQCRLVFNEINEIDERSAPIVPKKPVNDSVLLLAKKMAEHLYQLKNDQVEFFNNLPATGRCKSAMPETYLNYLQQLMAKSNKPDERLNYAQEICKNNCLNLAQTKKILIYLDAEFDKLVVAKLAYFNLVDSSGKFGLLSSFKYEGAVKDLRNFLNNAGPYQSIYAVNCTAITEESFMSSFIKKQAEAGNDSYRVDLLKKNYFNFCFSVDQISRILDTYTHDRERLQASKLLYFKCAEKNKFGDLSQAFSSPQSLKQLQEFIEMQGGKQ